MLPVLPASPPRSGAAPAPPRPAATILFVRDGTDGLEVLMVARTAAADFAAGALLFPGGKLCADDHALAAGAPDDHGPFQVAAVREAFEETGLLLARTADGAWASPAAAAAQGHARAAVDRGTIAFSTLLRAAGLVPHLGSVVPFAHIITPALSPKRFDTRFYLAATPPGQDPAPDDRETVATYWVRPAVALAWGERGTHLVMPPTRLALLRLARMTTVAMALADARACPPVPVEPVVIVRDGVEGLHTPATPGFPESFEPLDGFFTRNGIAR